MKNYLEKRTLYDQLIFDFNGNPEIIIIIPSYNEESLIETVSSIDQTTPTNFETLVITVFNSSESTDDSIKLRNKKALNELNEWSAKRKGNLISYRSINVENLPKKHAGVGLARKIGMDEATRIFNKNNKDGIIVCFDADSSCQKNYLLEIHKCFYDNPKLKSIGINFEHPVEGNRFDTQVYRSIIDYELHLRYYNSLQRLINLPYAYQTIGSSMAVRAKEYARQGGMNKRKAGEDFYFLHKFIALGNHLDLYSTKVIPSPRVSDRVPFGTGKAVGELVQLDEEYKTYSYKSIIELNKLISKLEEIYTREGNHESIDLHIGIRKFLELNNWSRNINEIITNTSNFQSFEKRFFRWFDAFLLMKFMHFMRDNFFPNIRIGLASKWILNEIGVDSKHLNNKQLLEKIRELDSSRKTSYNTNYRIIEKSS